MRAKATSRGNPAPFEVEFEVRDYECDLQGVVNNAVYLNYLEHARHRYLVSEGVDFAELHESGCDLVLTRIEVDYREALRSGDRFAVTVVASRKSRLRFAIGTALIDGRPGLPDVLQSLLDG